MALNTGRSCDAQVEAVRTWTYISALTSLVRRLNKEYDSYVRSLEITREDQNYECRYAY